jgi:hypothetical protein
MTFFFVNKKKVDHFFSNFDKPVDKKKKKGRIE